MEMGSGRIAPAVMDCTEVWPRGATPHSRSAGGGEEILLVQGKRNPSKMVGVARGHQRADTLKP